MTEKRDSKHGGKRRKGGDKGGKGKKYWVRFIRAIRKPLKVLPTSQQAIPPTRNRKKERTQGKKMP